MSLIELLFFVRDMLRQGKTKGEVYDTLRLKMDVPFLVIDAILDSITGDGEFIKGDNSPYII